MRLTVFFGFGIPFLMQGELEGAQVLDGCCACFVSVSSHTIRIGF